MKLDGQEKLSALRITALLIGLVIVVPFGISWAEHHESGYHHDHGSEGSVEHWQPRLEGEGRDSWQKPDELVGLLEISPGMVVADLGAGTGYFLSPLAAAVGPEGQVLALDVDQELVEHMAQRCSDNGLTNVSARVVAFDDPGLDSDSVDRVLIVNTWHHIGGREAYARKLAAALTTNGRVYVVDFTDESPHGPPRDHRLSAAEVRAELEAGGLATEVIDEDLPYQYVVVGRRAQP
jgi:cyclopropane fatty-acyl-phospholipid synthase-like methyltransferase